ncbi:MAG TPA: hypothetical protein VHT53_04785 [Candidatus Elarobacter sp.]|nr:hypothetical protein [Candidatus Elarobacter sp.]
MAALLAGCAGSHSSSLVPASGGHGAAGGVRHVQTVAGASYQDVCAAPGGGRASCAALVPLGPRTVHQPAASSSVRRTSSVTPADDFPYYGWWPSDVASAYSLPTGPRAGAGMTVAVVDAFDAPTAEADLAVYRSFFGLPPCTTRNGCFKKVNARGQPGAYPASGAGTGWTVEIALDLDGVSATCANCKIVLVESDSDYVNDLAVAAATAGKLADIVSNSYYAPEVDPSPSPGEAPMTAYVPSYRHNNVLYLAGTGDWGYEAEGIWGVQSDGNAPFPAGIPDVVAVGGTILNNFSYPSPSGWVETAAGFAGGGCSTIFAKPPWQAGIACPRRMTADVAATADGISVYDSLDFGGWGDIGGTSASTALVAGIYALARDVGPLTVANLYMHANALNDITSGDPTGTCPVWYFCNARPGYDGPTGMGSPNGTRAFQDLF